ncbi:DnaB-like helicase N-terminal domain-containing protein [Streptomyces cacaoi]|uniref:DnaB-like helicase N-terminal domain-containing protein n=1 Tax=Streptomyces cacaoi TaxID=1898 RepID=UPI001FD5CAAD|nr:DnaB-like helicase N-terminal domain-containing protein [Streptomyces cacaoi]
MTRETTDMGMDRVPPQDQVAERAVLGSMMQSDAACREVIEILEPGDFYRPPHATVYSLICSMAVVGDPVDPLTVIARLRREGEIDRVGGPGYVQGLWQEVPTAAHAAEYAETVRECAARRALIEAGTQIVQLGYDSTGESGESGERAVELVRTARDRGRALRDEPLVYLDEFLAATDDEPEWVIPGVLARWDRLMLTGGEGSGKSLLLRQMLMRAAAGLHPWMRARTPAASALLVDVENSADQTRPWLRRMAQAAAEEGAEIDPRRVVIESRPQGLDLTRAADRTWLLRRAEAARPDLIAIGPLYKLTAEGDPNSEEDARVLMSALESLRAATDGAALLIEAHSPHPAAGVRHRDMRPIGSSLWRRWPEFGFGLAPADEAGSDQLRLMNWQHWRGPRTVRRWPRQLCEGVTWPWQAIEGDGGQTVADAPAAVPAGITPTADQVRASGLWTEDPEDSQEVA